MYDGEMGAVRVAELFAGVGGFRIGLETANEELGKQVYNVVWSNQWEPGTKRQHASEVYVRAFGAAGHSNEDISKIGANEVPSVDLVVGGFPCQDYSVATTLHRAGGLAGKKGVLWWEIHRLLRDLSPRPPYVFLENVDRLLKSPASQRGRDFAVMLASLSDLGYAVEWRVINAADYGMPQRRRRVFILAYLEGTTLHRKAVAASGSSSWIEKDGVFAGSFPVVSSGTMLQPTFTIEGDLVEVTKDFNREGHHSSFSGAGLMVGRRVLTTQLLPNHSGTSSALGDVLVPEEDVPDEYFINGEVAAWAFLKGAKTLVRTNKINGHSYIYSEGGIAFPDHLDRASRTIITGEGGRSPSRFKHVVLTSSGKFRRLVPVELERLNMFPDDHTAGVPDGRRAFLMGNALVTGVVKRVGIELHQMLVAKPRSHEVSARRMDRVATN